MDYLIRFAQTHEDFRLAEIKSLASYFAVQTEIISYSKDSPFLVMRINSYPISSFPSPTSAAKALISRSVLSWAIYELWGMTCKAEDDDDEDEEEEEKEATYAALHADVRSRTKPQVWSRHKDSSFKFSIDAYCGKRSPTEQAEIINSFRYLGFNGPIRMQNPDVEFTIFEEWSLKGSAHHRRKPPLQASSGRPTDTPPSPPLPGPPRAPRRLFFGHLLSTSPRHRLTQKHDLKHRPYISTTSMDATLALVSANLAHAGPGRLLYDPFVGTGGFLVAAAEFGASVWGSDIDGRSFRGTRGKEGGGGEEVRCRVGAETTRGIWRNFEEYALGALFGDCFISDLTHTPLRKSGSGGGGGGGWLDGIICDPPYGVREGLKVLGNREPRPDRAPHVIDGVPAHTLPGYVAPKKPYRFERMLDDILAFAADTLAVDGRVAFWMPSANEDDEVLVIPSHRHLELLECCVQRFNRWSRRLLVYRRKSAGDGSGANRYHGKDEEIEVTGERKTASDLNPFRRKYFQGFPTGQQYPEDCPRYDEQADKKKACHSIISQHCLDVASNTEVQNRIRAQPKPSDGAAPVQFESSEHFT